MRHPSAIIAACLLLALAAGYRVIGGEAAVPVPHSGHPAWALLTFAVSAFGTRLR